MITGPIKKFGFNILLQNPVDKSRGHVLKHGLCTQKEGFKN